MSNEEIRNTEENGPETPQEEQTQATPESEAGAADAAGEWNDKFLRLYSEFDNYKRRTAKERLELMKTAGQEVLTALLPVLDDLDRALKSMESTNDLNAVKEGIMLVNNKFKAILKQKGLQEMESLHQPFDVDYHEALTKIPAPSEDLKGKVVDEIEKGYLLNEKVIRFAKVVVGE